MENVNRDNNMKRLRIKNDTTHRYTYRLDKSLYQRLKNKSQDCGLSVGALLDMAAKDFLNQQEVRV